MTTKLTQNDLKIYPSERLTDASDGGGARRGEPLTGSPDEIFKPISDVARTTGAFNAYQLYGGVDKPDDTPLGGAHIIISQPPKSPNVSYLLAKSAKYGETRGTAIKRIEAYKAQTIESRMTLLSTQTAGSKIIQAYQRVNEALPKIGDTFCLRQNTKGYEKIDQYVLVSKVSSEKRTFINKSTGKEFERLVIKMELNQALIANFVGAEYPDEAGGNGICKILETHVADGANYYGVQPIKEALSAGFFKIKVADIKEKIVPTVRYEIPLQNLNPAGEARGFVTGKEYNSSRLYARGKVQSLGVGIVSGTVRISNRITDRNGTLFDETGSAVGTVDYQAGTLIVDLDSWHTTQFLPATAYRQIGDSYTFEITENNRANNYLKTLPNPPAKGSVTVGYLALGTWYKLTDDGNGNLLGTLGSGSVNYATGDISLTLPEMPDTGSALLISWANSVQTFDRSEVTLKNYSLIRLGQALTPNSLSFNLGSYRYTDDDGILKLNNNNVGVVNYQTGEIKFERVSHQTVQVSHQSGTKQTATLTRPDPNNAGKLIFRLGKTNVSKRSVVFTPQLIRVHQGWNGSNYFTRRFVDDGDGNMIDDDKNIVGTIDYSAGIIYLNAEIKVPLYTWTTVISSLSGGLKSAPNKIVETIRRI